MKPPCGLFLDVIETEERPLMRKAISKIDSLVEESSVAQIKGRFVNMCKVFQMSFN